MKAMKETGEKKKPRAAWQRYLLLAAGLAAGLLLIAFGSSSGNSGGSGHKARENDIASMNEYAAALEAKARSLCEAVVGVGDGSVTVTVTLEGGFRNIYAEDSEKKSSQSGESVTGRHLTVGSGSSETPVKLGTDAPKIVGIGVVCRGGGDAVTRAELTALLSAAFGVGASKIYIAERG